MRYATYSSRQSTKPVEILSTGPELHILFDPHINHSGEKHRNNQGLHACITQLCHKINRNLIKAGHAYDIMESMIIQGHLRQTLNDTARLLNAGELLVIYNTMLTTRVHLVHHKMWTAFVKSYPPGSMKLALAKAGSAGLLTKPTNNMQTYQECNTAILSLCWTTSLILQHTTAVQSINEME